jgi:hypothetical protein
MMVACIVHEPGTEIIDYQIADLRSAMTSRRAFRAPALSRP